MTADEPITLTPYMRELLLEAICSRLNIIDYCQYILNAPFSQSIRNTFTGDCPCCSGYQAFVINKATGKYFCIACRQEGDFLDLMCEKESCTLTAALQRLTGSLVTAEEREQKSRYRVEVMI